MSSAFQRFVAYRYLWGAQGREEGRRFLRFVTYVAVGGVSVGVAALLLALSIVRGFSREIEAKIVGFGAHVQVESMQDAPLVEADRLAREIGENPLVRRVAPVVLEFTLLRRSATDIEGVQLWGTDTLPDYLRDHMVAGSADLQDESAGGARLVVGRRLADQLGLVVGDPVTLFSMRSMNGGQAGLPSPSRRPRVKQFHVTGIFETSLADFDEIVVFGDINIARYVLNYGPREVTRLDLMLSDVSASGAVATQVEDTYGFPVMARTIYEVFRGLFAWVNLQEAIIPLVISIIILVAAFNIVGTLLMIILEKTREIGVLASMGASRKTLRSLYSWLGLFIGVFGTIFGVGLALALALIQQRFEVIPLPADAYYMDTAPIALHALDFVLVALVTLVLCAVSAYIPARLASRVEPLKVIRFR